jgi:hypothetical protein
MSEEGVNDRLPKVGLRKPPVRTSWLGAAMALPFLAMVGELLIERTHHRPLGAATFATVAVVVWLGAESLSRHTLDRSLGSARVKARRILWGVSLLLCMGVVLRSFL